MPQQKTAFEADGVASVTLLDGLALFLLACRQDHVALVVKPSKNKTTHKYRSQFSRTTEVQGPDRGEAHCTHDKPNPMRANERKDTSGAQEDYVRSWVGKAVCSEARQKARHW